MKNAIILHGGPSKEEYYNPKAPSMSNAHWIPWLQGQLLKQDIPTATPEVPFSFDRNWKIWLKEVERYAIGNETLLIGHSTGAGFFIKYLSINKNIIVDKVILVAPFLDPENIRDYDFFHDYQIDPNLAERTKRVTVFYSDNDTNDIQQSVELIRNKINNVTGKEFHHYGHFTFGSMHTTEFPELLEEIIHK